MTQRTAPLSALAPSRLMLSSAEFHVLRAAIGLPMPAGFDVPAPPLSPADRQEAVHSLNARALIGAGTVHPSVAANLAVLARPQALIRTEVSYRDHGLLAVHAVAGQLGASLFAAADDGAELSMFRAIDLGSELARVLAQPMHARSVITESLSDPSSEELAGLLALAALEGTGASTDEERRLAGQVDRRTHGMLHVLVSRPPAADPEVSARQIRVGQVVWLATDAGWVGVRPEPDHAGRRLVSLEPVTDTDLGAWVAPFVAAVLS